jgi:PEP-CTERM motif
LTTPIASSKIGHLGFFIGVPFTPQWSARTFNLYGRFILRILFGFVACLVISLAGSNSAFAAWVYDANKEFVDYELLQSGGSVAPSFSNFTAGYSTITGGAADLGGFAAFSPTDHTDAWIAGVSAMQGWYIHNNASVPAIVVNTTNSNVSPAGIGPIAPSQILMHPGGISVGDVAPFANAVLRFTTTNAGIYSIDGAWSALDSGAASQTTRKYILKNGGILFDSTSNNTPFNLSNIVLATNDTIDFVVDSNGSNLFDSTGLTATLTGISAVPEPTTLTLFGLGGLGLAGIAKRRRARKVA